MHEPPKELAGIGWVEWLNHFPQLADIVAERPSFWDNTHFMPAASALTSAGFTAQDVEDASLRLERFAPLIARLFPETQNVQGHIESPLREARAFKEKLRERYKLAASQKLLIKLDNELPIAGSIKARGGVYEVLKFAEDLAMQAQQIKWSEDYSKLLEPEVQEIFSKHTIIAGSTGNLGLAVGITGRALGFKVRIHISREGRQWKKDLLQAHGVEIIEHDTQYTGAVQSAREEAQQIPDSYFIDDENSRTLFLGCATAAAYLKKQLDALEVQIDKEHPLHVYIPCGVGGSPAGLCFGLKLLMHDNVRCCFVEPVGAPAFMLGMGTRLYGQISVQDIGLSGSSAADGLAVSRPSSVATKAMTDLVDTCATVRDDDLFRLLAMIYDSEGIRLEPSALAGAAGYIGTMLASESKSLTDGTHILWSTGGGLLPQDEWEAYYQKGLSLL